MDVSIENVEAHPDDLKPLRKLLAAMQAVLAALDEFEPAGTHLANCLNIAADHVENGIFELEEAASRDANDQPSGSDGDER